MPLLCDTCSDKRAILKRPKTAKANCRDCFFRSFEDEIHHTIVSNNLFQRGDKVAIGASGGKDSTVLAYLMKSLNERHDYGLDLFLLSIDEGITGYRDDSLETVKRNKDQYQLPLKVVSYKELYGWTMDDIVSKIGLKSNCTFCGVFRRQALDRGAMMLGVDKIVTGHNADDIAETVLMNILRGDVARLRRCTAIITGSDGAIPRSKPFKYTYEKEIVMYAYFKKLDYFSTECIYSPNAYRGHARAYLKDLEAVRPSVIVDIIYSGDSLCVKGGVKMPVQGKCKRCGYIASQELCKACLLLEGLNRGLPRLGIGKATGSNVTKHIKKLQLKEDDKVKEKGGGDKEDGDKEVRERGGGKEGCVGGCGHKRTSEVEDWGVKSGCICGTGLKTAETASAINTAPAVSGSSVSELESISTGLESGTASVSETGSGTASVSETGSGSASVSETGSGTASGSESGTVSGLKISVYGTMPQAGSGGGGFDPINSLKFENECIQACNEAKGQDHSVSGCETVAT